MATALVGLVGQSLCMCGGHLLTLLFSKHFTHAAFLFVAQPDKICLMFLAPGSQSGEPGVEVVAAEPQEDGACCRHPLCQGGVFDKMVLAICSLL